MSLENELPIFVDICVFDETGRHVYVGRNCPHGNTEDETGQVIETGWTVQS